MKRFTFEGYREALEGVGPNTQENSLAVRSRMRTLSSQTSFACAIWPTQSRREPGASPERSVHR